MTFTISNIKKVSADYIVSVIFNKHFAVKSPTFFLVFSVRANLQRLLEMTQKSPDHLSCLDGLKVLSLIWVVYSHQNAILLQTPLTNYHYMLRCFSTMQAKIAHNGTFAIDTTLVISGTLISYYFVMSSDIAKKNPINILLYCSRRYFQ